MNLHNPIVVAGVNLVVVTCGDPEYGHAIQTYVARDGDTNNHHVIREFDWREDTVQQAAEAGTFHAHIVDTVNCHGLVPTIFGFVDADKLFEISLLAAPDQTTSPEATTPGASW